MKAKEKAFLTEKFNDYQNGGLNERERRVIDEWFDSKMENAATGPPESSLTANNLQDDLFVNIRRAIHPNASKKSWYNSNWLKIACSLPILFGLTFFMLNSRYQNRSATEVSWQVFSAAKGQVRKISLPDGTSVWLNAGTKIRLSSDFGASGYRKLLLDYGEAFFQVKRDTLRPFSITTGNLTTTVLGTSFNIRSYPELQSYKVAVVTGKVRVDDHQGDKIIALSSGLVKNQVLTYSHLTKKASVVSGNADHLIQWTSNRSLFFDHMTLAQIAAELSRQYDMEVKISGSVNSSQTYSMELRHLDIQTVLRQIVLKTGISYQLNNQILILNPPI